MHFFNWHGWCPLRTHPASKGGGTRALPSSPQWFQRWQVWVLGWTDSAGGISREGFGPPGVGEGARLLGSPGSDYSPPCFSRVKFPLWVPAPCVSTNGTPVLVSVALLHLKLKRPDNPLTSFRMLPGETEAEARLRCGVAEDAIKVLFI